MLKGHPKGLIVAFFANMGERFGFYTMMAILVLFLQARYGLDEDTAGEYYSWFYFGIYALALIGGMIADATNKYKTVIFAGIVIMLGGYIILFIPGLSLYVTLGGLGVIAFGNGLFKGNLQAVVGQLYDDPKYSKLRDSAFMVFYMGINVGAFFAPFAATGIRNWYLKVNGFVHDGSLPAMCHQFIDGKLTDTAAFQTLAEKVTVDGNVGDLSTFAQKYLDTFAVGYNYAFGIAAGAMIVSLIVYTLFMRHLPGRDRAEKFAAPEAEKVSVSTKKPATSIVKILVSLSAMAATAVLCYFVFGKFSLGLAVGLFVAFVMWMLLSATKEERPRVNALILVFLVVIFFWMSFHQNGLTLTYFARDYIVKEVGPFTMLFFSLQSTLAVIGTLAGVVLMVGKKRKPIYRGLGAAMMLGLGYLCYYFIQHNKAENAISPEVFQSFNPLFIVFLTPLVMGAFAWLKNKGKDPSTPKKIGTGMIIASLGFVLVMIASFQLISPHELAAQGLDTVPDSSRVTPYWLVSSYLVLTIAELFLSPMGLSFVSKVAPMRFQGIMQGGWLLATAVGNKFLFVGSYYWGKLDLWQLWAIFITCTLLSAIFIFSIMKKLERVGNK